MILHQLRRVLSTSRKRAGYVLFFLVCIGSILESLSVGVVVPVVAAVSDPALLNRFPLVDKAATWVGLETQTSLAVGALFLLVLVYAAKSLFTLFVAFLETKFVYGIELDVSTMLYSRYLRQPWLFHLTRNSSELIGNVTLHANSTALIAGTMMRTFAETLIVLALTALLVIVEPLGTLIVLCTVGASAMTLQHITRARVSHWGATRLAFYQSRLKWCQQGLSGFKETKLSGRERFFEEAFRRDSAGLVHALQREQFVAQVPRLWLEMVAVTSIALLVSLLILRDGTLLNALPALGLFGAATLRLTPAAARLTGSIQALRFLAPSLARVYEELLSTTADVTVVPHTPRRVLVDSIELASVSFRYPGAASEVLRSVSLRVSSGTSIGLIGPSGAGKSTLLDIIMGLLPPSTGSLRVNGVECGNNLRPWQDCIGYVPQDVFVLDDSIRRNVAYGLRDDQIDDDKVWRALRDASLDQYVRDLPQGLDTLVGERGARMSGGQRQRMGIARALYEDPPVLVMDEATSALDHATEASVLDTVSRLRGRKTVIYVAHKPSTLTYCDRVYRLEGSVLREHAVQLG